MKSDMKDYLMFCIVGNNDIGFVILHYRLSIETSEFKGAEGCVGGSDNISYDIIDNLNESILLTP